MGYIKKKKMLCMVLQLWIHAIIYLYKSTEYTPLGVNYDVNYGYQVMMCQVNVSSSMVTNTSLYLVWNDDHGDTIHVLGQECMGHLYVFHSVVLVNLKLL
jgi:hypothetical protein